MCLRLTVRRTLPLDPGRLDLGPTKNGDPHKVFMPSSVKPVLEDHLNRFVGPESDAPLFNGATGERLRPSNFWVIWEAARKRVGLEWVRFHDLRHFAATVFEMSDVAVFASFHTVRDEVPPGDMDSSGDVAVGSLRDEDLVGASIDPP